VITKKKTNNRVPLTRIQKLIGGRMLRSKRTKPCFYLKATADITELMKMRQKLRKSAGIRATTNSFYICGLSRAIEEYPLMVGRVNEHFIEICESVNVGFAVNSAEGLMVPVIKDALGKDLGEIAELEKELTRKARSNQLTLAELEGETVALSNLGAYGIDSFMGIVPPRASTILAIGNAVNTVAAVNGKPLPRRMVSLTLAVDHRIVDGSYGAKFLARIKQLLENPESLT